MLYQMVLADGIIDATELDVLYRIGTDKYGILTKDINQLIRDADIQPCYPESLEGKVSLLYQLGEIAWADGRIEDSERNLIGKYILAMGFDPQNAKDITDFILDQVYKKVPEQDVITQILND